MIQTFICSLFLFFVMVEVLRGIDHYQTRKLSVLSPEDQMLYLNSAKQQIQAIISKEDYEFIRENNLNMTRIVFFLVHEWLGKKKTEWQLE